MTTIPAWAAAAASLGLVGAVAGADPWTGFAAGVSLGYAQYQTAWTDLKSDWSGNTLELDDESAVEGVFAGYDHRAAALLLGLELDVSLTQLDDTRRFNNDHRVEISNHVRWYGTARARAGMVVGATALYLTGGLARAEIEHTWNERNDASDSWGTFHNYAVGYAYGLGVERLVGDRWSVRGEILEVVFPEDSAHNDDGYIMKVQDQLTVARLGAAYRF